MSKHKNEVESTVENDAAPAGEFVEQPGVGLTDDLATEDVPSLSDFAEVPGGALPRGWYSAEIIEGYSTRSGKQFLTEDVPSQKGDSRNLRIAVKVTPRVGDPKNLFTTINYRVTDFNPDRLSYIKELRNEMKGVKGRWPDTDAQRTSLAIAFLGQLEKALGVPFKRTSQGIIVTPLIGKKVDARLNVNEDGYNDITAFAQAGTVTSGPKKS